jgi:hypothetical protein
MQGQARPPSLGRRPQSHCTDGDTEAALCHSLAGTGHPKAPLDCAGWVRDGRPPLSTTGPKTPRQNHKVAWPPPAMAAQGSWGVGDILGLSQALGTPEKGLPESQGLLAAAAPPCAAHLPGQCQGHRLWGQQARWWLPVSPESSAHIRPLSLCLSLSLFRTGRLLRGRRGEGGGREGGRRGRDRGRQRQTERQRKRERERRRTPLMHSHERSLTQEETHQGTARKQAMVVTWTQRQKESGGRGQTHRNPRAELGKQQWRDTERCTGQIRERTRQTDAVPHRGVRKADRPRESGTGRSQRVRHGGQDQTHLT